MKVAIVCDDLIQFGGAERIVEALSDMFPEAPIYTSVASKKWIKKFKEKGRVIITSFLQKFPLAVKINRYYSPFLLHVLAFESFDFSNFDLVISSSSRYAHFIITKPSTKHICYMHSPGRMIWESLDYFENENYGIFKPIKKFAKPFLKMPLLYLRVVDFTVSRKVDKFIANSVTTQRRIKKYYGRDSEIVNPFVDASEFYNLKDDIKSGNYFLVLTRLSPWKKVDIAVKACESFNLKLKIIGDGPDKRRLQKLCSSNNIEFLGYLSDKEKVNVLRRCKAVIITQKEDFGIVPLEAMLCGKPVIAYKSGGVLETVVEGVTGIFFEEQTPESLAKVLKEFNPSKYRSKDCIERALNFRKEVFSDRIMNIVLNNSSNLEN
ncbi:glycosyltransferase family 4 protein [candidate division WWE3 bacterium]|uniref:Glycosyltransferase family 4 protein n=1 Tax=candidate division WWE3 bacterium TaxID=2053526 RepID=A0A7X9E6P4_UNCKA|nr:glycosyltransferase family 4 protein [candidate division WWE3 bacterium]